MLPDNHGERSRHGIHPEGDPHLSLPGIRDIFGLEATGATHSRAKGVSINPCPVVSDDLGTLVSQPHYCPSPKSSSLRLNATSAAHSASRSHLFVADVSSPESPESTRVSR